MYLSLLDDTCWFRTVVALVSKKIQGSDTLGSPERVFGFAIGGSRGHRTLIARLSPQNSLARGPVSDASFSARLKGPSACRLERAPHRNWIVCRPIETPSGAAERRRSPPKLAEHERRSRVVGPDRQPNRGDRARALTSTTEVLECKLHCNRRDQAALTTRDALPSSSTWSPTSPRAKLFCWFLATCKTDSVPIFNHLFEQICQKTTSEKTGLKNERNCDFCYRSLPIFTKIGSYKLAEKVSFNSNQIVL